ncbi:MAG: amidinotransferase [Candidatus Kapabacteria bacterium]|nr:amidinotransferase [Candidatus Kapabacteria bacterium]
MARQRTSHILMIEPVCFGFNDQTAASNSFQHITDSIDNPQKNALREFTEFVSELREAGIDVTVIQDTEIPHTPDSIFPNNWFSTHDDGTLVLYPMATPNRRAERKEYVIQSIKEQCHTQRVTDMSSSENNGMYLEGTGSMVLDRKNAVSYCALSHRTHRKKAEEWCAVMGYTPIFFNTHQTNGTSIYHTNVIMSIGERIAVVCFDAMIDESERRTVRESLESSGRLCIGISLEQMNNFAGNLLELQSAAGASIWIMSDRAWHVLHPEQQSLLADGSTIIHPPLETIEQIGGGSARCMIAELFAAVE